jgi:hypothetical protein
VFENQLLFHSSAPPPLNDSFNDLHSNLSRAVTLVGTISAVGKRVWASDRKPVPGSKFGSDSDHIWIPITINWFAGVSIARPAVRNMLRCV